jgi:hypothetical protein
MLYKVKLQIYKYFLFDKIKRLNKKNIYVINEITLF